LAKILNCAELPDPMLHAIRKVLDQQNRLEGRLHDIQRALSGPEGKRLSARLERDR
jgi:hypothetical protein